ncbi:MAG: ABC transporter ATP-binding protein [Chloroflexi bacterium]|nr:ABC transporter ATP-binding protein [Chloroflexota bacterium]
MANVEILEVTKKYKEVTAVDNVSLNIEDQEFLVLLGPSGCGKSTLLKMIAGLEEITRGEIYINGKLVNYTPPKDRDVAMVFQNYALYPHMTVKDNIGFSLKMGRVHKGEIGKQVEDVAKILQLDTFLERRPEQLSGGQRQRVALGRAIVRKPAVFLMDEPLSNLDAKLRIQMREELLRLHDRLQATIIYVTHDQIEAMTMGSRIVLLRDGVVQQIGPPQDVYDHPVNAFVAGFLGSPSINFFEGQLVRRDGTWVFASPAMQLAFPAEVGAKVDAVNHGRLGESTPVSIGVRPENFQVVDGQNARMKGEISLVEFVGSDKYVYLDMPSAHCLIRTSPWFHGKKGDTIGLEPDWEHFQLFDAEGRSVFWWNPEA